MILGGGVGFGDPITVRQIGLLGAIENGSCTPPKPWKSGMSTEESIRLKDRVLTSEVFLVGTNTLSLHRRTVNVGGPGSRVGAMLFGPTPVLLVASMRKFLAPSRKRPPGSKRQRRPSIAGVMRVSTRCRRAA